MNNEINKEKYSELNNENQSSYFSIFSKRLKKKVISNYLK